MGYTFQIQFGQIFCSVYLIELGPASLFHRKLLTMVIFVSRDLMFQSRIRPQVQAAGFGLVTVASCAKAIDQLQQLVVESTEIAAGKTEENSQVSIPIRLVVVDLKLIANQEELVDLSHSINLTQKRQAIKILSLAYGPHVKVDLLESAKDAGFEMVMTQGQFDRGFGEVLAGIVQK